jgi:hypothetical protein
MAACDYTLLGEEIFAASAYLSKEPVLVGSVVGQDLGKIITFCIIIIGTILQNIQGKDNWLSGILKK